MLEQNLMTKHQMSKKPTNPDSEIKRNVNFSNIITLKEQSKKSTPRKNGTPTFSMKNIIGDYKNN